MKRIYMALRRLWLFATCSHRNTCQKLEFPSSDELLFCRRCGRILSCMNEGERRHNVHLNFPVLDYTKAERNRLVALYEGDEPITERCMLARECHPTSN